MLAQADDHAAQRAAGRRLEQPGAGRHAQDVAGHDQGAGRVDEERRHLLVGKVGGHRHHLADGDDDLFLPVAAGAVEHGDALAGLQPPQPAEQAAADRLNDADALEAGRGRQPG